MNQENHLDNQFLEQHGGKPIRATQRNKKKRLHTFDEVQRRQIEEIIRQNFSEQNFSEQNFLRWFLVQPNLKFQMVYKKNISKKQLDILNNICDFFKYYLNEPNLENESILSKDFDPLNIKNLNNIFENIKEGQRQQISNSSLTYDIPLKKIGIYQGQIEEYAVEPMTFFINQQEIYNLLSYETISYYEKDIIINLCKLKDSINEFLYEFQHEFRMNFFEDLELNQSGEFIIKMVNQNININNNSVNLEKQQKYNILTNLLENFNSFRFSILDLLIEYENNIQPQFVEFLTSIDKIIKPVLNLEEVNLFNLLNKDIIVVEQEQLQQLYQKLYSQLFQKLYQQYKKQQRQLQQEIERELLLLRQGGGGIQKYNDQDLSKIFNGNCEDSLNFISTPFLIADRDGHDFDKSMESSFNLFMSPAILPKFNINYCLNHYKQTNFPGKEILLSLMNRGGSNNTNRFLRELILGVDFFLERMFVIKKSGDREENKRYPKYVNDLNKITPQPQVEGGEQGQAQQPEFEEIKDIDNLREFLKMNPKTLLLEDALQGGFSLYIGTPNDVEPSLQTNQPISEKLFLRTFTDLNKWDSAILKTKSGYYQTQNQYTIENIINQSLSKILKQEQLVEIRKYNDNQTQEYFKVYINIPHKYCRSFNFNIFQGLNIKQCSTIAYYIFYDELELNNPLLDIQIYKNLGISYTIKNLIEQLRDSYLNNNQKREKNKIKLIYIFAALKTSGDLSQVLSFNNENFINESNSLNNFGDNNQRIRQYLKATGNDIVRGTTFFGTSDRLTLANALQQYYSLHNNKQQQRDERISNVGFFGDMSFESGVKFCIILNPKAADDEGFLKDKLKGLKTSLEFIEKKIRELSKPQQGSYQGNNNDFRTVLQHLNTYLKDNFIENYLDQAVGNVKKDNISIIVSIIVSYIRSLLNNQQEQAQADALALENNQQEQAQADALALENNQQGEAEEFKNFIKQKLEQSHKQTKEMLLSQPPRRKSRRLITAAGFKKIYPFQENDLVKNIIIEFNEKFLAQYGNFTLLLVELNKYLEVLNHYVDNSDKLNKLNRYHLNQFPDYKQLLDELKPIKENIKQKHIKYSNFINSFKFVTSTLQNYYYQINHEDKIVEEIKDNQVNKLINLIKSSINPNEQDDEQGGEQGGGGIGGQRTNLKTIAQQKLRTLDKQSLILIMDKFNIPYNSNELNLSKEQLINKIINFEPKV